MTDPGGLAPPRSVATKELIIRQETRVGWFAVRQLLATAGKTLTSTIIGSMSGRRELMAALDPRPPKETLADHDYRDKPEMWIDYIADTGDGWDATLSVAWLAGRNAVRLDRKGRSTAQPIPERNPEEPSVESDDSETLSLPAGRILIFGGDQVYPTASGEAYQGRLQDPFQSARFYEEGGGRQVYAIPGNHDWYDGLTAFIRLFCQKRQRWIGAWRTQQRRSYFAIRLPYQWWVWGIDMALEDDLDPPQIDYFTERAKLLKPGDKVILCVPNPTWVRIATMERGGERTIESEADRFRLIRSLVTGSGARVRLALSGDLHHYARHHSDETDYIIAGGGGAFTLGTSQQPELAGSDQAARRVMTFPSDAESRAQRRWALNFPIMSPGFTATLTAYQLVLSYAFNLASQLNPGAGGTSWVNVLSKNGPGHINEVLQYLGGFIPTAPISLLLLLVFLFGFAAFAGSAKGRLAGAAAARLVGVGHGLLQFLLGFACFWLAAGLTGGGLGKSLFVSAFLIYAGGGLLFGAYLLVANVALGMHEQEVFSCQAIERFKCFLRLRLTGDGLTVYAIGLREVSKGWKLAPGVAQLWSRRSPLDASVETALLVPERASRIYDPVRPLSPHLIEPPFSIN